MSDVTVSVTAEPSVDISVDATIVEASIFTQAVSFPASEGLKTYASMAELDALRVTEIGILKLTDTAASIPALTHSGNGPSELVVVTNVYDYLTDEETPEFADVSVISQNITTTNGGNASRMVFRVALFHRTTGELIQPWSPWAAAATLPAPSTEKTYLESQFGVYFLTAPSTAANGNIFAYRQNNGQITVPTNPSIGTDAASKNYVDNALATATPRYASQPPTTGFNVRGAIVWNNLASAGGYAGWICIGAGVPGTWREFAPIAA